jgi:PadR family transcriptional regulator, regulatory protein PadR
MTDQVPLRLSRSEELLLEMMLVRPKREMYGLELVRESGGKVARGSVYVLLDRLEEKGLVESRQEEKEPHVPGIARRLYKVTGHGKLVLAEWRRLRELSVLGRGLAAGGGTA